VPSEAVLAMPAEGAQTSNNVIADSDSADLRSDLFDHTGRFVSQNRWEGIRISSVHKMQVRVADARRRCPDEYLVGPWFVDLNIFDLEWFAHLP